MSIENIIQTLLKLSKERGGEGNGSKLFYTILAQKLKVCQQDILVSHYKLNINSLGKGNASIALAAKQRKASKSSEFSDLINYS